MRKKNFYLLITFATTTQAMAFESFCIQNNIQGRLIPVPGQVRAGCGLAWRCSPKQMEDLMAVTKQNKIKYESMCELEL